MLKRNIKIILIGVLVLGFFGLIYSFLSSKPEIVSDTGMRSNKPVPPIPTLARGSIDAPVQIMGSETVSDDVTQAQALVSELDALEVADDLRASDAPEESRELAPLVSLESEATEVESVSSDIAEVLEEVGVTKQADESSSLDESAQALSEEVESEEVESEEVESEEVEPEADAEPLDVEIAQDQQAAPVAMSTSMEPETTSVELEADGSVMDAAAEEQAGEPMLAIDSDVEVLPEQTGFIDLNLTETASTDLKLIEGDDLILDDINEDLLKYQIVVSTMVAEQSSQIEPMTSDVAQMLVAEGEVTDQGGIVASVTPEPTVVSIPEPDDTLINGDDTLSQQYRETYAKLKLVTTKLSREDEKNKALKVRFVEAAGQNREMDEKINEINQKIIELTAKK